MRGKGVKIIVFILSLISLMISMKLFYNMGVYVDEFSTNPSTVLGGDFWLYMDWLRLAFIAVITAVSGASLFSKNNSK